MRSVFRFIIGTGLLYQAIQSGVSGDVVGCLLFCSIIALLFFKD